MAVGREQNDKDAIGGLEAPRDGQNGEIRMPRIVVLVAGIGGVPMAFELRERLVRKVEIDVVSELEWFQFVPSNPWVAVSWRSPKT